MTIVIPVADDIRLKDCLASIDEDVEVVISMNSPTPAIREITKASGNRYCEIPEKNLGAALDEGIKTATSERILLMDSDCTFNPGTIKLLYDGLDGYKLAKGRVLFQRKNYMSGLIAKAREYVISDVVNAYKPPLALKKSIVYDIGGYYYDRDIHWVEDSEFNSRVKKFGIPINYLQDATINHPPLTAFADLRSAFRYGIGKRIGVEKGIMHGVGHFFRNEFDISKKKGLDTSVYMLFWNASYVSGYLTQMLFDVYNIKDRIKPKS